MNTNELTPPHEVRDETKLASLIEAYSTGASVTPIVVLDFGDEMIALCGSHRIAALQAVFAEIPAGYVIVVAAASVVAAIDATPEDKWNWATTQAQLYATREDSWGDFDAVVESLLPYLPMAAQDALADQH